LRSKWAAGLALAGLEEGAPDSFCFQVNDIDENRSDWNPEELVPVKEWESQKAGFYRIVKRYPEQRYER
jgi:hypothetical protein